jgi:uncharacterized protein (DUF2267 family)
LRVFREAFQPTFLRRRQNGRRLVMLSLSDAVTPGEFDDVISQLPDDFKHLRRRAWAEA